MMPSMPYHQKNEGKYMDNFVTNDLIRFARKADLYGYLLENHDNEIEKEGDSVRLCENHSVSIKKGYSGYMDFATDETGNAIECLTNYFGYTFQGAVLSLCEYMGYDTSDSSDVATQPSNGTTTSQKPATPDIEPAKTFTLPEPVDGLPRNLYAYLTQTRKIPEDVVQWLISEGVMYQEREHNNIVFVNPERTFAELRGTNTYKSFHRVAFSDPAAFWWFKGNGLRSEATIAFICESAIDAISLYCMHRILDKWEYNVLYCSIAGVSNQQRIDRIKAGMSAAGLPTVLAVDNDDAGNQCRQRNLECDLAIPYLKDWNEVWVRRILEGKI